MADDIDAFLRARGASDAEIARARDDGWLPLLALDRLLMPGERRYDGDELAERAGTDRDTAHRLWRALGFPDILEGIPAFTDRDAHVLRRAVEYVQPYDVPNLYRRTRVISLALTRVAATEADLIAEALIDLRHAGMDDDDVALQLVHQLDWATVEELIDYVHRVQLRAALWRRLALGTDDTMVDVAIAFADLTGYTALSQQLEPRRLVDLVFEWDTLAHDTVTQLNARIVKTIGDEVMIVGLAQPVADAVLELVRRAAEVPGMPPVRCGAAVGPVLARDGDYYGPVVNLASRLTDIAAPGSVLVWQAMHDAVARDPSIRWELAGTRHVRSIGDVVVYEMRRVTKPSGDGRNGESAAEDVG
jgi:adenylate cyclase